MILNKKQYSKLKTLDSKPNETIIWSNYGLARLI